MKIYIVHFWETCDDPFCPSDPAIHKVVATEKQAKDYVKEFTHMFYTEYTVEQPLRKDKPYTNGADPFTGG